MVTQIYKIRSEIFDLPNKLTSDDQKSHTLQTHVTPKSHPQHTHYTHVTPTSTANMNKYSETVHTADSTYIHQY